MGAIVTLAWLLAALLVGLVCLTIGFGFMFLVAKGIVYLDDWLDKKDVDKFNAAMAIVVGLVLIFLATLIGAVVVHNFVGPVP